MICFEVSLNGERLCVAGIGEGGVLTTNLAWISHGGPPEAPHYHFHVGGMRGASHVRWLTLSQEINVGDQISVNIVESDTPDEPELVEKRTHGDGPHLDATHCAFCQRAKDDVPLLIPGPHVSICSDCIETCADMAKRQKPKSP